MNLVIEDHTVWDHAARPRVRGTDRDLAEAEVWTPPPEPEKP